MFLIVKEIDGEDIIVGTAKRKVVPESFNSSVKIYEIADNEFKSDMIYSKIEDFDEV